MREPFTHTSNWVNECSFPQDTVWPLSAFEVRPVCLILCCFELMRIFSLEVFLLNLIGLYNIYGRHQQMTFLFEECFFEHCNLYSLLFIELKIQPHWSETFTLTLLGFRIETKAEIRIQWIWTKVRIEDWAGILSRD